MEVDGEKIANLNMAHHDGTSKEPIKTTIWERIEDAIKSNIKTEEYNGRQCYKISTKMNDGYIAVDYYDKEIGWPLYSSYQEGSEIIREHEFNNVDDSVFVQPDASEYKLINE